MKGVKEAKGVALDNMQGILFLLIIVNVLIFVDFSNYCRYSKFSLALYFLPYDDLKSLLLTGN